MPVSLRLPPAQYIDVNGSSGAAVIGLTQGRQGIAGPDGPQGPPGPGTGAGAWQPATAYTANQVVQGSDGSIVAALDAHTSGATFAGDKAAHWISVSAKSGTKENDDLSATYAGKNLLPAARLRAWGHSIMWGGSTQNADACVVGVNDQATLISQHLGLPLDKQAISGTSLYSNVSSAASWKGIMQYEVRPKRFSALGGVYVLMYGINDMCYIGQTVTLLNPFKQALRAVVARMRCSAVFENDDASVTYGGSGTWTTTAQTAANSGAGITWNTTSGGTFTITTPANFPGGTIDLAFVTLSDGGGGVITAPASLGSVSIDTTTFSGTDCWRTGILRISNVPAGNTIIPGPNTYTFTISGVTGGKGVIFDWWGWEPEDAQCPIVVLQGQPKPIDYSSETGTPTGPGTDAGVDAVNTVQQAVATEFGSRVLYVDNSYYDKNTNAPVGHPFYVAANVHPSADVHAGMALNAADAIKALGAQLVPGDLNDAVIPTGLVGWQGYNPTLDGSGGTTLGDGTSTAYYKVDADGLTTCYGRYVIGAATVIGTLTDIPLPLTERAGASLIAQTVYISQSSVGSFPLYATLGNVSGKIRLWQPARGSRGFIVSTTSGNATIAAPAGTFSAADVGAYIIGPGIVAGTTIASITNDTTAVMSANAAATASTNTATLTYKVAAITSTLPVKVTAGSSIFWSAVYRSA